MNDFHCEPGDPTVNLPFAHGGPVGTGLIRRCPEDFQVIEQLGYEPDGDGEHVFLRIRKRNLNTNDLARRIARLAGVRQMNVSYAGMKDKIAVTTQHFTVQLPGMAEPDWAQLEDDDLAVEQVARHRRKIRRGALRGNRFILWVRDFKGDRQEAEVRLRAIAEQGVPNYFGPQRFGRNGGNMQRAAALFSGELRRVKHDQRGLLLSSVRSWLFNLVLAGRVRQGNWNQALPGDVMLLANRHSQFAAGEPDEELVARVRRQEVHPSGPLCGRASRSLQPDLTVAALEQELLSEEGFWLQGLEQFGLEADRRALRLEVPALSWQWQGDDLQLSFELTAGSYATTVLRELVEVSAADHALE